MFRNIFSKIFKKKKTKRSFKSIGKEEYNFDFQVEKDIYQNLCCNRVKKKVIEMLEQKNLKFYTYSEWKQYIYNKYKNCNRAQLLEFIRYLNQGIRNTKTGGKYWELLIPVIMTLVFTYLFNYFGGLKLDLSGIPITGVIICILIIGICISIIPIILIIALVWNTVKPMYDNFADKNLFVDYKEIIDEMINKEKA